MVEPWQISWYLQWNCPRPHAHRVHETQGPFEFRSDVLEVVKQQKADRKSQGQRYHAIVPVFGEPKAFLDGQYRCTGNCGEMQLSLNLSTGK